MTFPDSHAGQKLLVPAKIHQIWFDWGLPVPPPKLQEHMALWRALHPAWKYTLWGTEDARTFVSHRKPEYLAVYDGLPFDIQRCDFFRLIVLLVEGGVYLDADTQPHKPLDPLRIYGLTLALTQNNRRKISNFMFMAAPQNPFIAALIDEIMSTYPIKRRGLSWISRAYYVLESTGPCMLQRVARRRPDLLRDAVILPARLTTSHSMNAPTAKASSPEIYFEHLGSNLWFIVGGPGEDWRFLVGLIGSFLLLLVSLGAATVICVLHRGKGRPGVTPHTQQRVTFAALALLYGLVAVSVALVIGACLSSNAKVELVATVVAPLSVVLPIGLLVGVWYILPLRRGVR